jgi:hypothetical protein
MISFKAFSATILLISLMITSANAQEEQPESTWSCASVYATATGGGVIPISLQYDYLWIGDKTINGITPGVTAILKKDAETDLGLQFLYTFMTGAKKTNHFELKAGVFMNMTDGINSINPVITLGYRYQKPDGRIFFRIGVGLLRIGIGTGYRFK